MAKKASKKSNPTGGKGPPPGLLRQVYPTITRWASGYGWVEFGIDERDRPFVRAQDEGGTVWEGEARYGSLDEALGDLEAGLGEFLEEEGFNKGRGGSTKKKKVAAPPEKPKPPKKTPPEPSPPGRDSRVRPEAAPPVPREVVEKVRKLADIAEALHKGQRFEITRLTSIKGLCKNPRAAQAFAMFLAVHARQRTGEKKVPERVSELMDKAVTEIGSYLGDPTKEGKERLYPLLREMEQEQNEHKRISWGQVRIVHSMELVVVENALKSLLRDHEAPFWLYHAARDYAERYDPRHGTGLIPSSARMMQDIADFWREFYGIDG